MSAIRDQIVSYLTDRDVPAHIAAAIAGNFSVETGGFKSQYVTGDVRADNGKSGYLAGWNGQRLANLEEFAASRGEKVPSIATQLDFMALEFTPGHRYSDPIASKNKDAIFTAPTVEKAVQAFSQYYERPSVPHLDRREEAARDALKSYVAAQEAAPAGRSITPGLGLANLVDPQRADYIASYGPNRPHSPNDSVINSVRESVANVFGPGYTVQGISGKGNYGAKGRHPTGLGLDFDVLDPSGKKVTDDRMMHQLAVDLAAKHGTQVGIGYGKGYMAPGRMHVDLAGLGGEWGKRGRSVNMDPELRSAILDARETGVRITPAVPSVNPTPRSTAVALDPHVGPTARSAQETSMAALNRSQQQTPASGVPMAQATPSARSAQETSMAALQQQAPAVASAHVGPSARSAQESSMAALAQNQAPATINVGSVAPVQASAGSLPGFGLTAAPQASAAPAFAQTSAAPSVAPTARAQDVFNFDSRAQQDPFSKETLSQAANSRVADAWGVSGPPARGAEIASMAALADYNASKSPAQTASTLATTAQAPVQVASLGAPVGFGIPAAPTSYAPTPAIGPTPTARPDTIASAIVNNAVSPTPQNSTSSQSRNYAPISDYLSKDTGGIFGKDGIFSPANVQNAMVGTAGGLFGALAGSVLGPFGSLVGGTLGRHFAQQQFGVKPAAPIAPLSVPEFNALMAANYTPGLSFPTAPVFDTIHHYESGGGPSYSDMAAISPGAADAISEGRGGLY